MFTISEWSEPHKATANVFFTNVAKLFRIFQIFFTAFSGDGNYRNNASYQWLSEKGPLPLGKWYIMDDLDRDDWWELWWGEDQRIDDTAQNPNGDGERTSVRFHEGHLSQGCITVAQGQVEWQIVKLWLQSMDSAFELTDYEEVIICGTNPLFCGVPYVK